MSARSCPALIESYFTGRECTHTWASFASVRLPRSKVVRVVIGRELPSQCGRRLPSAGCCTRRCCAAPRRKNTHSRTRSPRARRGATAGSSRPRQHLPLASRLQRTYAAALHRLLACVALLLFGPLPPICTDFVIEPLVLLVRAHRIERKPAVASSGRSYPAVRPSLSLLRNSDINRNAHESPATTTTMARDRLAAMRVRPATAGSYCE